MPRSEEVKRPDADTHLLSVGAKRLLIKDGTIGNHIFTNLLPSGVLPGGFL